MFRFTIRDVLWLTVVVATVGCGYVPPFSSGGGSFHKPPTEVDAGEPTTLSFEFTISGVAGVGANNRYKNEKLFYRVKNGDEFQAAKTDRRQIDEKRIVVSAEIPPIEDADASRLEYYLTIDFDDVKNSRGTADSPLSIPIQRTK